MAERARQEADAYRGDNPRPLGAYVAVLGVYTSVVVLTALITAVTSPISAMAQQAAEG